jgi:hypothetical protein
MFMHGQRNQGDGWIIILAVGICSFLFDKLEQYESIGRAFLEKEAEPAAHTKPSGEKQPVKRCVMGQAKRVFFGHDLSIVYWVPRAAPRGWARIAGPAYTLWFAQFGCLGWQELFSTWQSYSCAARLQSQRAASSRSRGMPRQTQYVGQTQQTVLAYGEIEIGSPGILCIVLAGICLGGFVSPVPFVPHIG